MNRRDFLKLLAATTLGTFGSPAFAIRKTLGPKATKRKKLKDAIEELRDDPEGFVYLLGATFAQTSPDLRLASAAVLYWVDLNKKVHLLIRAATKLKNEPEVVDFLDALRAALLPGKQWCYGGERQLTIEARVIMSVWVGCSPAEMFDRQHGKGRGVPILKAYVEQFGSTLALLEMADAEVVI